MSAVYRAGRNWQIGPDTKEGHGVSLSTRMDLGLLIMSKVMLEQATFDIDLTGHRYLTFFDLLRFTLPDLVRIHDLNSRSAHIDTELSFMMLIQPED